MHKDFRKLTADLEKWLANLSNSSFNLEKSLIKNRKALGDSEFKNAIIVPLDALINRINQLQLKLSNQDQSLKILKRTPPGFIASIIDFLHHIVVNPNSETEKNKYYDQLNRLDKNINKDFIGISSALNVPESQINQGIKQGVESALKIWQEPATSSSPRLKKTENQTSLKEQLEFLADPVVKNMFTPRLVEDAALDLVGFLTDKLENPSQVGIALSQFIEQLEVGISKTVKKEKREQLLSGFATIKKILKTAFTQSMSQQKSSNLKIAQVETNQQQPSDSTDSDSSTNSTPDSNFNTNIDITELEQVIKSAFSHFSEYKPLDFVKYSEQLINNINQSISKEKMATIKKYDNYIKNLMEDSQDSIKNQINKILETLESLEKIIEAEKIENSTSQNPQSK